MRILILLAFSIALAGHAEKYDYSNKVRFQVEGLEFRDYRSYPEDRKSPGYKKNAKNDLLKVCDAIKSDLETNENVTDFQCTDIKDIATRRKRSQYRATIILDMKSDATFSKAFEEVTGDRILASDYESDPLKWQTSRRVARESYFEACNGFIESMKNEFGDSYLVADCGVMKDDGGDTGWRFFSTPRIYTVPKWEDIPECSNGKKEDQSWWETEESGLTVPISCEFGGDRTDAYDLDTEYVCDNQEIAATGDTRRGEFRGSQGSCNLPANCGDRAHGDSWVVIDEGNPIDVARTCQYGGNRYDSYERENHYSCYNGDRRFNGSQRGRLIGRFGSCYQPASCGIHDHGDRWWERTGRIRVPQYCPYGGNRVDVYEELTQFRCNDGSTRNTGRTQRGNFIRTRGSCNDRPPRMMPPRMMPPRMMPPRMMPPRMMPPRMMPPRMMPPRMMPPRMMPPRMMPPRMMPPRMMPPRMMPPRMMPPRMMPPRMMPPRMMPPRMMPPRMMPPRMMPPRMMPPRMMPPRMMPPRMMPPRMMPPRMMPPRMMPR